MKSLLVAALLLSTASAHAKGLPNPLTPFTAPKAAVSGALLPGITSAVTQVQTVTLDDLKNALADANAQTPAPGVTQPGPYNASVTGGDVRHGNCWAALIDFVGKYQASNLLPNQAGLATLQQKIFDDQQIAGKPLIPDYVITNCALTFNDAAMNLVQVANWLGLKAVTLPKIP